MQHKHVGATCVDTQRDSQSAQRCQVIKCANIRCSCVSGIQTEGNSRLQRYIGGRLKFNFNTNSPWRNFCWGDVSRCQTLHVWGCFPHLTLAAKRQQAWADLHEHAEAGFEQVCEASGHVLNVRAFGPVGVEHFLQKLSKERSVGRLQKHKEHTIS